MFRSPTHRSRHRELYQDELQAALSVAAQGGHAKLVRELLHDVDDSRKKPQELGKLLKNAIEGDHDAAARMLIAAGADVGHPENALELAAHGHPQCVKALLELARSDAPSAKKDAIKDALAGAMAKAIDYGIDEVALQLLAAQVELCACHAGGAQ